MVSEARAAAQEDVDDMKYHKDALDYLLSDMKVTLLVEQTDHITERK